MPPTRERRWWTSGEDDILKERVQTQLAEDASVQNWSKIALSLPGRTNKDCRKRWSKIQQAIRKGTWTQEEDARLQQAVSRFGFRWSQVATIVQNRNADQCAKRWQHVLGPELKHSPWTPAEDAKLLKGVAMHGNNWKEIGALELPDRSAHDIRNRSLLLERRSRNKAIQPPSPNRDLDPTIGKLADADAGEESENDDGSTHNEHSEYNAVDSLVPQHQQVTQGSVVEHYAITAPESMDCNSIERLRYAVPSSDAGQGIQEPLGFGWTGSQERLQPNPDLLTPESACISWLDPFQASVASNFASPQYQWWSGTPTDELGFQNPESLDLGYFSLPEGDGNPSSRESVQDSLDLVDDSPHDSTSQDQNGRGSITLTLDQVDPDVARRIIGSVLEHGEGHKIRYSFNAT